MIQFLQNHRRVINRIFHVLRTGIHWADLPSEYRPPTTLCNRFNRWTYAGHRDRIMEAVADAHNVDTVMVDGTSVRVHHSATTPKKRPASLHGPVTGRFSHQNICACQSGRPAGPVRADARLGSRRAGLQAPAGRSATRPACAG